MTGTSWLAGLAVLSGLSMNLMLQFGLGLRELILAENLGEEETSGIADSAESSAEASNLWFAGSDQRSAASTMRGSPDRKKFLTGLGIFFALIFFLWLVFSFVRSLLPLGFFEFVLLFPASYLAFYFVEYAARRIALAKAAKQGETFVQKRSFVAGIYADGMLCGAALFVMLNVAGGIADAAVLSLGFTLGIALTILIVGEIRRRAAMETVPQFLKGGPLALVAMGLLSLVFSAAAVVFFEVLVAK